MCVCVCVCVKQRSETGVGVSEGTIGNNDVIKQASSSTKRVEKRKASVSHQDLRKRRFRPQRAGARDEQRQQPS